MYIMYGANEEDAAEIEFINKMSNADDTDLEYRYSRYMKGALTIMGYAGAYPGFSGDYTNLNISDKIYEGQKIDRGLFSLSTFTNCLFANCRVYLSQIMSSKLQNCIFENCTFICTVFDDGNEMINVTFSNCKFIDSLVCVDYEDRVGLDPTTKMYYKTDCFDDPNHVYYENCIHSYITIDDPYVELW